ETHFLRELGPRWTIANSIGMPVAQRCQSGRRRWAGGIHGGFGAEMLDYTEIPRISVLVPQDDVMSGHGRIGCLLLEGFAVLGSFAEGSFGEVHVVNVSTRRATRRGSCGRSALCVRKGGKASRRD